MKIGVIGLGKMGSAIAQRLIDAGYDVVGFDLNPAAQLAARQLTVDIIDTVETMPTKVREIFISIPAGDAVPLGGGAVEVRARRPGRRGVADWRGRHRQDVPVARAVAPLQPGPLAGARGVLLSPRAIRAARSVPRDVAAGPCRAGTGRRVGREPRDPGGAGARDRAPVPRRR